MEYFYNKKYLNSAKGPSIGVLLHEDYFYRFYRGKFAVSIVVFGISNRRNRINVYANRRIRFRFQLEALSVFFKLIKAVVYCLRWLHKYFLFARKQQRLFININNGVTIIFYCSINNVTFVAERWSCNKQMTNNALISNWKFV